MSDMQTSLMTGIENFLTDDPLAESFRGMVNDFGMGLARNETEPPYVSWFAVDSDEDYFLSPGKDHYNTFTVQFSTSSDKTSPKEAMAINGVLADLFRDLILVLPVGRHISSDTVFQRVADDDAADGQEGFLQIDFQVGT
jgi:hypothetical protein